MAHLRAGDMELVAPGGCVLWCNLLPAACIAAAAAAAAAADMAARGPATAARCMIRSFWHADGGGHVSVTMSAGHAVVAGLIQLLLRAKVGACKCITCTSHTCC